MNEFQLRQIRGMKIGTFTHFDKYSISHGISTRHGGVSKKPYESLNLALHTGDQKNDVLTNRRRFCQAVGVSFDDTVTAEQVHGSHITVVTAVDAGKGMLNYEDSIAKTDALITNVAGLSLMLCYADCVPVLIADPKQKVVAVSHAGWKGTVAAIAQKTVQKMMDEFGCQAVDCLVGIGPSIGFCSYEVDEQVISELQRAFSWWARVVKPEGKKWKFDLWQANAKQLMDIGVAEENIICSNFCTACNKDLFFSHRAERGQTGRMAAIISLP
ncbi:YfiH family protein [Sporomusaceae bacterium BoRhaA]|uniref:peptidoglycan editing factor PgeF n=1 Tax=Pelorhabdus rhamnosifermentans TaxID=2772457 RepID=UPI001C064522|nr:peptidoglycan editing factor PgeF [Pelorhabdus rhamnosifermentans]MBU2700221.1 YfiH family protein [Pelorhabdus rhamnosifermentans]